MSNIKIALIGCGFFGQQLALGFTKAGADLLGVTDLSMEFAERLAAKFNTKAYSDMETLFHEVTPDLVLIATPNYAHKVPALTALKHGCHIFIETPFSIHQTDCSEILTLAKQKKKSVFIGHLLRTLPGLLKAKELMMQNVLGKITVARASRQRWIDAFQDKNWWKNDVNLTGGKLFNEIHELDLLCWLLGDVSSVYAQATNRAHTDTPDNHDIIQLLLQFESGVFASLEMGTAYRLHEWGITIHGELGALMVNFFTSTMTLSFADGTRQQFNLYDEFEADLSLRESGKATQKYNLPTALSPLWLTRAVEIEADMVVKHLLGVTEHCILSQSTTKAIAVACAAKKSIETQQRVELDTASM
ncbi:MULTISPECIES: Gfo/Idh/MocA family protein [Pasteurella]|uniref:Gfo/Idh/MocA family protein n=1 Tax=Pasteurella TaxID=745 RepID=UPI0007761781|nr:MULTISPECIES: Gfo/Idh/MocA family oxidoreductase [Pasteurella]AMM82323.1 oxidoreductase [Pasteurella multocida subsp. multocida PMTB2.1]APW57029.1 oxidoreductase [Pasteurella multocida]ATC20655.1 gfo/Idh/MocA family oxidoreductase [Pasteurella multocida]AXQ71432.1 oxidoreductase [Pasteurella multocida subsp. multocida]MCH4803936.1 Gfo/Idh/MocA family oxidoreductase [Pasteurella multocida]